MGFWLAWLRIVMGVAALVMFGGATVLLGTCMVTGNCLLNISEWMYPLWRSMASFIWTMDGNPRIVFIVRLSLSASWIFTCLSLHRNWKHFL
jgi:hypothetical protein